MAVRAAVQRRVAAEVARFRRGGRTDAFWAVRLTVTAVAAYVVASAIFPHTQPLLAPLTALLVVQVTPVSLLSSGLDRVVSVVAGVSLAVVFSTVVPLTWWSLGVLIAASLLIGQVLRLQSNLIEVAISAMLVLGVGSLGAESAAWERFTVTIVGAAVGIVANLVFPSKVATADASRAIDDLANAMSRLLLHAADELEGLGAGGADLAAHARGWLDEARAINYDMPNVGAALLRAEQGRRLNVRAVGTPDVGPGLRQGLEALEHTSVALRSMFRTVLDAATDPAWPEDEVGEEVVRELGQVFREMSAGVDAFGELVRVEADPERRVVSSEVERLQVGLEGLHEARARIQHLQLLDTGPVLSALHATLVTVITRLERELDLDERIRRQLRLLPRYGAGRRPARLGRPLPRRRAGPPVG